MSGFGMVLAMRLSDKCDSNNELLTLLAIGNYVDENGRGCYAAQQTLADKVLVSLDTVKRCIPRLAAKGLISPGDPSLVAQFRADRRPRVWDILGAREPADETGVHGAPSLNRRKVTRPTTGAHSAPPSDNSSSATGHGAPPFAGDGPTGVQTISPRGCTVHPNPPKEEPAKDPPLPPARRIVRSAGLALAEEEEEEFIAWANHPDQKGPHVLAWWEMLAAKGDLAVQVTRWRTAHAAAPARDSPEPIPKLNDPDCPVCHGLGCENDDGFAIRCRPAHPNRRATP